MSDNEPAEPDTLEGLVREIAEHERDGDLDGRDKPKTLTEGQAWASLMQYIGRARVLLGLPQRFSDGVRIELPPDLFTAAAEDVDDDTCDNCGSVGNISVGHSATHGFDGLCPKCFVTLPTVDG